MYRSTAIPVALLAAVLFTSDLARSAPGQPDRANPYPHFYCTGYFAPGQPIEGRIVGPPGTSPVGLFISAYMLDPPLSHMWGNFYLNAPWFLFGPLGTIHPDGVMTIPATLPTTPGPYNLYMQALIGWSLSNLFVMEVRNDVPSGMVMVPGGAYQMGDHEGYGNSDERPVHDVLVDSFLMDTFEVNTRHYCEYLNAAYSQGLIQIGVTGVVIKANTYELYFITSIAEPDSRIAWTGTVFKVNHSPDHPIVLVSWYGAVAYANWRSEEAGLSPSYDLSTWKCDFNAGGYRLPTEAEWEYAARGGEHDPYYKFPWGNIADGSYANYVDSGDPFEGMAIETSPVGYFDGSQIPVGTDMANGYSLYDMAGNTLEWVNDWYDENYYASSPVNNPVGPASGTRRVLRGGAWTSNSYYCRCACRAYTEPVIMFPLVGFRLVLQ